MSNQVRTFLRSPTYPSMSLEDALSAVAKIENKYRTSIVDRGEAAKLIGYSSHSGPAGKALAALASYGLLERAGKGETRVTDRAKAILYAGSDEERLEGLMAAAFEPPLFRDLRERFGAAINDGMLPESGVIRHLEKENFNPNAVRPASRAFLKTMEFLASNGESDSHGAESSGRVESPSTGSEAESCEGARVGDYVQWEYQGALQFKEPRRVRFVTDDGKWLAVEGSEEGIPMEQAIVEKHEPMAVPPVATPLKIPLSANATDGASMQKPMFFCALPEEDDLKVLHDGERLQIVASVGREGIARLKKMLDMYEAFLASSDLTESKNDT